MDRRINTRGVIIKDNKIFAVVHKRRNGTIADYWCVPGGGLEIGEPIIDGLRREIIEETGVEPVIGRLLFIHQFLKNYQQEQLELFFEIKNVDDFTKIDISNTSHGTDEIHEFGFVDPKTVNFMPRLFQETELNGLLAVDRPVEFLNYL